MMHQQIIARRYAKGLMLACEESRLDRIAMELESFVEAYKDSRSDLDKLFLAPAFSLLERQSAILGITKKYDLCCEVHNFLLLLIKKDRAYLLPWISSCFQELIDNKYDRLPVVIESATSIGDDELKKISQTLKDKYKKEIIINSKIKPELLGGIRILVGGTVFDGSVKAQLDSIKKNLLSQVGFTRTL